MDPGTDDPFLEPPAESAPADETPRLGILHLMVLTACVALYSGTVQGLQRAFRSEVTRISEGAIVTVHVLAAGAALAGLVLFAARRRRGMPFPIHPGEFLIVLLGMNAVALLLGSIVVVWYSQVASFGANNDGRWVYRTMNIAIFVINVAWWIWAFIRLKAPRWRLFLLWIPVCQVLAVPLLFISVQRMGVGASMLLHSAGPVLISVALGIVVLWDHLKGLRYPWTHWFGVAVWFWHAAAMVISGIIWWLSQP